ncbi:hypothetical protein MY11210_009394 [Beauveria gryllotalpidicola]
MFGSRKRATPVQPLTKETANANAATAAASAFMRRSSDASLSSAAAAAALRARPTSPTNVAEVQSKRLSRRSPSVPSTAGNRRELTRTPSVGSMMERTFRSPSPGRSPAPVPHDVPPIPRIPNTDSYTASSRPRSSSRKGRTDLHNRNFRTASEKMRDGQKGSWFAAPTAHDLHAVRRTASELQLSSIRMPSEPRPGSVSPSINFSYPRARLHSPTGSLRSLQVEDQTLVYDPNSRRMVPRTKVKARSQALYQEDYELVRDKSQAKKQQPRISRVGSHLSRGTVARTKAPALETNEAELELPPGAAPEPDLGHGIEPEADAAASKPKAKKKKPKQIRPSSSIGSGIGAAETPDSSILPEMTAELPSTAPKNSTILPSSGGRIAKLPENADGITHSPNSKSKVKAVASREPSESPARSARFAAATDQLIVRHEPPSRSLSPRKSALKHASPTRAVSPSDDGSDVSGAPGTMTALDDARKKSFRVSWDDRNTVLVSETTAQFASGQATNSSPQMKKSWHSIVGKGSKKDAACLEKEEGMSPRPALPSFGSVREKKPREQEERPLVRPEHVFQTETPVAAAAVSAASLIELNTSKQREPLPTTPLPSVKKGEELPSSEDELMEDTSDDDLDSEAEAGHHRANGVATNSNESSENQVPTIAIFHASPRLPQTEQHEKIARVNVGDEDSSSASEELEVTDAHTHGLLMDDIKEEEEEGDMYSDAYEEIAEPAGDGFLSLDAVLESTTSSPKVKSFHDKLAVEGKEPEATETINQGNPPDDWENAKAFWKSLSSAKRRQLEQEAMEETDEEHQETPERSKTDSRKSPRPSTDTVTPTKDRSYQIAPGPIPPHDSTPGHISNSGLKSNDSGMRKSMRGSQHNGPPKSESRNFGGSLRTSMRSEGPYVGAEPHPQPLGSASPTSASRKKRSLRHNSMDLSSSEPRPSIIASGRPASYHAAVDAVSSTPQPQIPQVNGSPNGARSKTTSPRRGSDSSESSFTRARAASSGIHEFRRSMRGSMREPPAMSNGMRTLSPPAIGTRRDSVSSLPAGPGLGAGRLRHSLRGESADPPARRRIPGFGKSTAGKSKEKSGSRFGDSSDEDEGHTSMNLFKSRFADSSSDDDEPPTKVKGKNLVKSLRTKANTRATSSAIDLPFARDGREPPMLDNGPFTQPKRTQAIVSSQHQPGSGRGALVPLPDSGDNVPSPPRHSRRGSFISLLRRKKDPSSQITRDLTESAARQDTNLERSTGGLEALRNMPLHKRGPSWPLPEPGRTGYGAAEPSPERPSTAGGAIVSTSSNKSKFMRRRSASQGMVPADTADMDGDLVTDTVPPKKKKFGALRKMFGLHD